jgi:AmmeMemoRadiSam system protein B
MKRMPAVAGSFYPADPAELQAAVAECLSADVPRIPALALLAPHAGYIYSGPCAGKVYSSVELPERIVVLCPNHTGFGAPLAIRSGGSWQTPLGEVPVDEDLAAALKRADPDIREDGEAHRREHALEVQLPFLQVLRPEFRLTPICVGTHRHDQLERLGEALASVIREADERILIVISSDMSHYIAAERARELDGRAIAAMEAMDPGGLHDVVHREGISMCGIAPAVAGLFGARRLGARKGRLIAYTNSGDRTGDYSEVVAYAGLVFE